MVSGPYMTFHLSPVTLQETTEVVVARERMGGRLCQDLLFERHSDATELSSFRELDVTHAGIKVVDLSPVVALNNLAR